MPGKNPDPLAGHAPADYEVVPGLSPLTYGELRDEIAQRSARRPAKEGRRTLGQPTPTATDLAHLARQVEELMADAMGLADEARAHGRADLADALAGHAATFHATAGALHRLSRAAT